MSLVTRCGVWVTKYMAISWLIDDLVTDIFTNLVFWLMTSSIHAPMEEFPVPPTGCW